MNNDGKVTVDGVPIEEIAEGIEDIKNKPVGTNGENENVLTDLPTSWDFTDLYSDEEAFEADMKRVEELLPKIETLRGKLNTVDGLLKDLEDPDLVEIKAILNKGRMYTKFISSLDATDSWAKKASARYNDVYQKEIMAYRL